MPRKKERWSEEETVIAVYFISRDCFLSSTVASEVMVLRGYTARDPKYCRWKVLEVRQGIRDNGRPEVYDKDRVPKYDLDLIDTWLSRQIPNKGQLEASLGIKDGKIVDEKVMDILKKYV